MTILELIADKQKALEKIRVPLKEKEEKEMMAWGWRGMRRHGSTIAGARPSHMNTRNSGSSGKWRSR